MSDAIFNWLPLPLRATVENDELSIVIGVRTLAFAFENSEENNPYDEDFCATKRQFSISDPSQFAKDVCHELNSEGEDGSTPLTRFLDSMMGEAVNQGSLGILDPDETADSDVSEHTEIRSENLASDEGAEEEAWFHGETKLAVEHELPTTRKEDDQ